MAIEQALISKLEPHAKRIRDGDGNDFDYLPAVLLHLLEEQKRQAKLLDDTAKLLAAVNIAVTAIGEKSKEQILAFERGAQLKMQQIETATKNNQTLLESSKSAIIQQITVLADAHAAHTAQTSNGQSAISLQIESLDATTQQSHVQFTQKFKRLLIAGLVVSTILIGLALAILQRQ
jgi:hypothetical protein